jgi:hypothetical protein
MALYVYNIADGTLVSWGPTDSSPVASDAELAARGFAKKVGLPPLDATHVWDAPTQTVVTIVPPKSTPGILQFWQRFTATEREAIENMYLSGTIGQKSAIGAFYRYVQAAGGVNCDDSYIQAKVNQLETIGVLASGRAAQILV